MATRPIARAVMTPTLRAMDPAGTRVAGAHGATLSERIESLVATSRSRGSAPQRQEVEDVYTDGCAEVLVLEAEYLKLGRELAAARARIDACGDADSVAAARALSQRFERMKADLDHLRSDLRQLRAALEWAQSGAEIERRIGFDRLVAGRSAGAR